MKAVWLIRVYWYKIKILIFSRENKRFYYRRKEDRYFLFLKTLVIKNHDGILINVADAET